MEDGEIGELMFAARAMRSKVHRGIAAMRRKWGDEADTTKLELRLARLDSALSELRKMLGGKQ